MKRKNYLVLLTYILMAYYYTHYSPSAFMFLVGLLLELIIVLILYLVVSFKTGSFDSKSNAVYLSILCIPIILFHYFIAWSLTEKGDMLYDNYNEYGLFFPMKGYFISILFVASGLVISYFKDFRELIKNKNSQAIVEYSFFSDFFKVWAAGLVGLSYCEIKRVNNQAIVFGDVILLMLIARIISEFISNYNFSKSTGETL